jgi:hypothetical protein
VVGSDGERGAAETDSNEKGKAARKNGPDFWTYTVRILAVPRPSAMRARGEMRGE